MPRSTRAPRRARHAAAAIMVASLAGLGAAVSASPASAHTHDAPLHVTINHYAYAPASLSVSAGETVTWTNLDSVAHDVTVTRGPALFHSPMLSKGRSWSFTFTVAGPYSYICSVHPDIRASVTVTAGAGAPASGSAPALAASAQATTSAVPGAAAADSAGPPASQKPADSAASPAPSAAGSTGVSPLLFVGGGACAVLMFALLMLAERPRRDSAGMAEGPLREEGPAGGAGGIRTPEGC